MAKSKASPSAPQSNWGRPTFEKPRGGSRPIWAAIFFVFALMVLVSLADFHPNQSSRHNTDPETSNMVGLFGVEIGWWSIAGLGAASWFLPAILFYISFLLFRCPRRLGPVKLTAMTLCVISTSAILGMQQTVFTNRELFFHGPGGVVGDVLFNRLLRDAVGIFGSALVLALLLLLGVLLLVTGDLGKTVDDWMKKSAERRKLRAERKAARREEKLKERELRKEEQAKARELKAEEAQRLREEKERGKAEKESAETDITPAAKEVAPQPKKRFSFFGPTIQDEVQIALPDPGDGESEPETPKPDLSSIPPPPAKPKPKPQPVTRLPRSRQGGEETPPSAETADYKPRIIKSEVLKKASSAPPVRQGKYKFPQNDLLARPDAPVASEREDQEETAKLLIHTLNTFGVEARVDEIHVGPVITRYDILPAPGTKVSKIQGLENDIAMGLKAMAVRIIAPVPGKGCVGVEVPNRQPLPVSLREIIESEAWVNSRADIPVALGKDVSGQPLVADLTKMPHLLIAGSTGSGKTVCINSVIASLLYRYSPDKLRFIMVDPKIVEMKVFNDLPHMLIPVVTEPKKVPGALKWLLNEMERRYQIFATIGVRNIGGFNEYQRKEEEKRIAEAEAAGTEPNELDGNLGEAIAPDVEVPRDLELEIPKSLPYIVCIIDELADLMMVAPAEIETGIARLAQLARAAGIHLILATQRPSVNVITGVIKANLPSRIAFKVASKVDSRTILDGMGAEQLIGRGDMLFLPPGSARLIRSQGAFVSDDEITSIVEFLKVNGPPRFAEDVQRQIDSGGEDGDDGGFGDANEEDEELFQDALDVLRNTKRASTSMLQRKLRIGYNRAARIMELMEQRGIVGPENGASPREILVDLDSL